MCACNGMAQGGLTSQETEFRDCQPSLAVFVVVVVDDVVVGAGEKRHKNKRVKRKGERNHVRCIPCLPTTLILSIR